MSDRNLLLICNFYIVRFYKTHFHPSLRNSSYNNNNTNGTFAWSFNPHLTSLPKQNLWCEAFINPIRHFVPKFSQAVRALLSHQVSRFHLAPFQCFSIGNLNDCLKICFKCFNGFLGHSEQIPNSSTWSKQPFMWSGLPFSSSSSCVIFPFDSSQYSCLENSMDRGAW